MPMRTYTSVPDDIPLEELTLEQGVELLARQTGPGRPDPSRRRKGAEGRQRY